MSRRSRSKSQKFALSYVNPTVVHEADGTMNCRSFFDLHPPADPTLQIDLKQLLAGNVTLVVLSHGNNQPELLPGSADFEYVTRGFTALRTAIAERPRHCSLVETKADFQSSDQHLKILLHLTGAPINGSLQNLETFFNLGVRAIHPFCRQPEIGGFTGCGDPNMGITSFGRDLIRFTQKLNMVVDVCHTNDRTFREVLRICKGPVINSHTASRKLRNTERNSTDSQLKAVAQTGGVVGVHFGSSMLWEPPLESVKERRAGIQKMQRELQKLRKKYRDPYEFLSHRYDASRWDEAIGGSIRTKPVTRAPLSRLVDHLEHMLEVAGEDHVGLGTDYSLGDLCDGVTQVKHLSRLSDALKARGIKGATLEKMLWKNWLRVFREVIP